MKIIRRLPQVLGQPLCFLPELYVSDPARKEINPGRLFTRLLIKPARVFRIVDWLSEATWGIDERMGLGKVKKLNITSIKHILHDISEKFQFSN